MAEALTKFEKWVDIYGQGRLAKELEVSRQTVNNWIRDNWMLENSSLSTLIILIWDEFLFFYALA